MAEKQNEFVNRMKDSAARDCERHRLENEVNANIGRAYGGAIGDSVRAVDAERPRLAQYTPLLVQTVFELYCFPSKREELCTRLHTLPRAQQEVMELLKRADIVRVHEVHVNHSVSVTTTYTVDEDALRAYVNAVCSVPLPRKHWVMS